VHNKIKSLNGKVFAGLSKLKEVNLESNECVDKTFYVNEIATIAQNIPEACSFDEIETTTQLSGSNSGIGTDINNIN
jgi:hypothetical protein